jgi:hypothetical protein
MIYVVKQWVTHPLHPKGFMKISKIVGRDLRHAAEMLKIPESNRRDIERTGKTVKVDPEGRRTEIEVIAEEKV